MSSELVIGTEVAASLSRLVSVLQKNVNIHISIHLYSKHFSQQAVSHFGLSLDKLTCFILAVSLLLQYYYRCIVEISHAKVAKTTKVNADVLMCKGYIHACTCTQYCKVRVHASYLPKLGMKLIFSSTMLGKIPQSTKILVKWSAGNTQLLHWITHFRSYVEVL